MRFEYKFLVHNQLLETLRAELQPFVRPDHFAAAQATAEYTVRSIYFDTARLDFYHAKIEGLKTRKKIRIRGYNEQVEGGSRVFLEIKKKIIERCFKQRAAVNHHDLAELFRTRDFERCVLPGSEAALAQENAARFFYHIQRYALRPVILIAYEREAFQGKLDSTLRLTLDKRLRYRLHPGLEDLYAERQWQYARPHAFILEIKFTHGFSRWLQGILKRHHLQRTDFSKYAVCVEAGWLNTRYRDPRRSFLPATPVEQFLTPDQQRAHVAGLS